LFWTALNVLDLIVKAKIKKIAQSGTKTQKISISWVCVNIFLIFFSWPAQHTQAAFSDILKNFVLTSFGPETVNRMSSTET